MPSWDELLGSVSPSLLLLIVGAVVAAESAFIWTMWLPGATGLLALGFFARLDVVELAPAMFTGMCAALVGSTVGYLRGRRSGLHERVVRLAERISGRPLPHDGEFLRRWGGPAIAGCQWVVVSRTLMPRLAASGGWSYRRFAPWSVPSAALWGSGQVGFGWLAGEAYREVAKWSGWIGGAALLVLTGAAIAGLRSARRPRARRARLGRVG